jgi:hypothetical protein
VISVVELLRQVRIKINDLILTNHSLYIEGTSWIDVQGNKLHPHCFTCSQCNVSLANHPHYDHNGMSYCPDCDTRQFCPKCDWCSQVICRGTETDV